MHTIVIIIARSNVRFYNAFLNCFLWPVLNGNKGNYKVRSERAAGARNQIPISGAGGGEPSADPAARESQPRYQHLQFLSGITTQ